MPDSADAENISCRLENGECLKEFSHGRVADDETVIRILHDRHIAHDPAANGIKIDSGSFDKDEILKGCNNGWSFTRQNMLPDDGGARLWEIARIKFRNASGYGNYACITAGEIRDIAAAEYAKLEKARACAHTMGVIFDGGEENAQGDVNYKEHISVENCVSMRPSVVRAIRKKMLLMLQKQVMRIG